MKVATPIYVLLFAAATLLFNACATAPKVRVDKDASTVFANYRTFAWLAPQREPAKPVSETPKPIPGKEAKPEPTPEANSLVENRVRTAVISKLQAQGYTLNEATPDFRVSYVLNVYERPKDSGMRIGFGTGTSSRNVSTGVGFSIPIGKRTNMMAAMTIDIIDAARNTQVWTGSYEDKVEDGGLSDASANKMVNTILVRFPSDATK